MASIISLVEMGIALLLIVLSIYLQKKIIVSKKFIVLKSIGNFLLLLLLQFIMMIGFLVVTIEIDPVTAEGAGGMLLFYVFYSPFIFLFNLIVLVIAHVILRKKARSSLDL